eukprot:TRINITY_DN26239_c0_g2_i1.p1 TRINITY_DN26239_c0_g2~~TRINITY_DN26239_c0_g2_i1.p1  ORF type:complete len:809 (-),score=82.64 TRINITY_DN26239_c0_g2_i1:401-2827(-)
MSQPSLDRTLTPSGLSRDSLAAVVSDAAVSEHIAELVFMRAIKSMNIDLNRPHLDMSALESLTERICHQMHLEAPPSRKLELLCAKYCTTEGEMFRNEFKCFFETLLQQLNRVVGKCQSVILDHATDIVPTDDKPPLGPQVNLLFALLGASPQYFIPTFDFSDTSTWMVDHASLDSIAEKALEHPVVADWVGEAVDAKDSLGWDSWSSNGMMFSHDTLTASKRPSVKGYAGAIGNAVSSGVHHFAFRVWQPVDDAFFVGICSPDCPMSLEPKRNDQSVIWSGGGANRPGTVRLFGEKLRQMPTYVDGDVIGVSLDFESLTVSFFRNGELQFHFGAACRGTLCPFFSVKVAGPAATLLTWRGPQAASASHGGPIASLDEELCHSTDWLDVDGSLLEGGGQVLRVALSCAALLRKPLHIHSIRSGRSNPGLGAQHTAGAKLVADCCNGLLSPDTLNRGTFCPGVNTLRLWPSKRGVRGGTFVADTRSAGATTLLLQASLPCCLLGASDAETLLVLRGGTNVLWSPPVDHTSLALLPLLHRMGVPEDYVRIALQRRGFHPQGGGEVRVQVKPIERLVPLQLLERGDARKVIAVVFARGVAKPFVKELVEMTRGLLAKSRHFHTATLELDFDVDDNDDDDDGAGEFVHMHEPQVSKTFEDGCRPLTRKERREMHAQRLALSYGACGVQLVAHGTAGGVISANSLTTDDFKSVPVLAVKALEEQWLAGGALDEHLMDQLVIYMAMAEGRSSVLCNGPTSISSQHLETAVALSARITGARFAISNCEGVGGARCVRVDCEGIGWLNLARSSGVT